MALPLPLSGGLEIPSLITLLYETIGGGFLHVLLTYQDIIFAGAMVAVVCLLVKRWSRDYQAGRPSRLQNGLEFLVEAIDSFVCGMLGKENGRAYLPFLGALFFYILFCNLMGLVPFLMAPTAVFAVPVTLAVMTFLVVQYTAITKLGPFGYIYHLAGEPKGGLWIMAPLFLVLHVIGEFAKPLSLSLRLFGNVLGKDVLLAVFLSIGVTISLALHMGWLPIPLHLPFMFLGVLLGGIQALVFMMLATVYIQMSLPHQHEEEHGEAGEHGGGH